MLNHLIFSRETLTAGANETAHGRFDLIVPRCFLKQALSGIMTRYKKTLPLSAGSIPYGIPSSLYNTEH
jgi:hypothetical protein